MWWDLAFRIFNFVVLLGILYFAIRTPLSSYLKKRQETIRQEIEDAQQAKQAGQRELNEYKTRLQAIKEETAKILQAAIREAERERERIIEEAKQMAEKIKRQAEQGAQQELQMARQRLQEEVAAITVKLTEELLKKHLEPGDHERLVDEYIEQVRVLR